MAVKPNLPPSAQPWGRKVDEQLRGTRRVRGASVQAVNGILQANGATEQRLTETNNVVEEVQAVANTAMETADGKNTVSHILAGDPRPVDNAVGDLLFEHDTTLNGPVTFMGRWDGSDWESIELNTEVIAALDAGKITTGTLNAGLVTIEAAIGGGSRVVIDNTGFKGYNSANELKTQVGADGTFTAVDATVVGLFRNNLVGQNRIEIQPYGSGGWGGQISHMDTNDNPGGRAWFGPGSANLIGREDTTGNSGSVGIVGNNRADVGTGAGLVGIYGKLGNGIGNVNIGGNTSGSSAGIVSLSGTIVLSSSVAVQSLRNSLNLGNTTGAVPIANGGTGATTAQAARTNLGMYDTATWDTGWVSVTLASGFTAVSGRQPQVRRIGNVIYWQGALTGSWSNGVQATWSTSIPSWASPARGYEDAARPIATSTSAARPDYATIAGTSGVFRGSFTGSYSIYLGGLSGYLVD